MRLLETDSLSNQSLASAVSVGSYTADRARQIFFRVFAKQIAGNGNYAAYCKVDKGGLGTVYEMVPRTTAAVASGVTAIVLETMPLVVNTSDIISVWLVGLAGDTTTPDIDVEVWEANYLRPSSAALVDVDVDADGLVDTNAVKWAGVATATDDSALATVAQIAAAVDSNIEVTLAQTPTQLSNILNYGELITIYTHSKLSARLYVLGGVSVGRDDFLLTIKTKQQRDDREPDSKALLQWSEDSGLLIINQQVPTALGLASSDGTLTITNNTVDGVTTGIVDLTLSAQAAAYLRKQSDLVWDGKEIYSAADDGTLKIEGTAIVKAAVTLTNT